MIRSPSGSGSVGLLHRRRPHRTLATRRLVGPGGEVLEALQELTRLAVQAETGDRSRLMLDVASFRADRRAELVRTAKQAIEAVKESGERRELEPMTAFERKVVHDEVLAVLNA